MYLLFQLHDLALDRPLLFLEIGATPCAIRASVSQIFATVTGAGSTPARGTNPRLRNADRTAEIGAVIDTTIHRSQAANVSRKMGASLELRIIS
jgi:hypothetical protein